MKKSIKNVSQKLTAILLAFILILGTAPVAALSEINWHLPEWLKSPLGLVAEATDNSGTCGADLAWLFNETTGELSISGMGDMTDWTYYSDVPWHKVCSSIKTVSIASGVTSIGCLAFSGCTSLTNIAIPSSVTSIKSKAFSNTGYYNTVSNWKNGVLYIGTYLIEAKSSELAGDYTIVNGTTFMADSAFRECTGLTSVTIPNSVTNIGSLAFYGCTSLTSVTIPSSVTSISESAFHGCTNLANVIIPSSITSIGEFAFYGCTSLTSVTIPSSVTSISRGAFCDCTSLTSVTIPASVKSIGSIAFCGCTKLTNIAVNLANANYSSSDGVLFNKDKTTLIQYPAGNTRTSYTIPSSVTSIGDCAFYGCTSLTSVTIPDSVTNIGSSAFYGCTNLANVIIPSSITSVSNSAFYGCTSLTSVTIPDSVTNIGSSAFYGCTSLTNITIPSSVTSINSEAFFNTGYYNTVSNWKNGVLYIGTYLIVAKSNILASDCTIVNGTTFIADYAFYYCNKLTSITIPNSVTSIGIDAFYNCDGLTCVTIPKNVTSLGFEAFYDCNNLTSVNYNAKDCTVPLEGIYHMVFENCDKLTMINIGEDVTSIPAYLFCSCKSITSITIPSGVTSIGDYAFYNCSVLMSATISNGVTSIREGAFRDCSVLKAAKIPNSVTSIGDYAFYGTALTDVTIPVNVSYLGSCSFEACIYLTTVTFNAKDCKTDGKNRVFSDHKTLTIGEDVTIVPLRVFDYNSFTNSPTTVNYNAKNCTEMYLFESDSTYCNNIVELNIGKNVTTIPPGAFKRCRYLTDFTIPDSVTSIGYSAFYECFKLTTVTIPENITSIGYEAFSNCSLKSVNFNAKCCKSSESALASIFDDPCILTLNIGQNVTTIPKAAFEGCEGLTNVTIPNSVTSIGDYAFYFCRGLTDISIPDSITDIGNNAFAECKSLTEITIPENVHDIGYYAFGSCENLTTVNFNATNCIRAGGYYHPYEQLSLKCYAFHYCDNLKTVNIGDSVTNIPAYTFFGCKSIASLTIPNSVTNIGNYAFEGCEALNSVTIPSNVTSLGSNVFKNCINLAVVNYNAINCTNYAQVFKSCTNLTTVNIGAGVTIIPTYIFMGCSALNSVSIPLSVCCIGKNAFYQCNNLSDVYYEGKAYLGIITIGDGNTDLSDATWHYESHPQKTLIYISVNSKPSKTEFFVGDTLDIKGLALYAIYSDGTTETITDGFTCSPTKLLEAGNKQIISVEYLGKSCTFYVTVRTKVVSLSSLTFSLLDGTEYMITNCEYSASGSLVIPDTYQGKPVTRIKDYAFDDCHWLTSVTIPKSIKRIGCSAFGNCSELAVVNFNAENCTYMGSSGDPRVFNSCKELATVNIGNSVTIIPSYAFENCTGLSTIVIPNSVRTISDYAFSGCNGLTNVTIGDGLTWLYATAFVDCNSITAISVDEANTGLKSIDGVLFNKNETALCLYPKGSVKKSYTIPATVTSICDYAFSGSKSLVSVTIPDCVRSIGKAAFFSCTGLTSVKLPKDIQGLEEYVFYGCTGLTSVTIQKGLTSIQYYVFTNCTGLTDVYYEGSQSERNKISIYSSTNESLINATWHYDYVIPKNLSGISIKTKPNKTDYLVGETLDKTGLTLTATYSDGSTKTIAAEDIACTPTVLNTKGTQTITASYGGISCTFTVTVYKQTVLADDDTGVMLIFPDNSYSGDVTLEVTKIISGSAFNIVQGIDGAIQSSVFSIETYVNGVAAQPDGYVTVKLPVPQGYNANKCKLYYVNTNTNKAEEISLQIEDGYFIFTTNHFSNWAIVEMKGITAVTIDNFAMNYKSAITLTPKITADEGAQYTVKWESSNPKAATVDEKGKVTATGTGTSTITCTVTDKNGNTVKDTATVKVTLTWWQWLIKILLFGWIWY